ASSRCHSGRWYLPLTGTSPLRDLHSFPTRRSSDLNARTVSGAGARAASAPERKSSTPRNVEATIARSAVRSVGGRSSTLLTALRDRKSTRLNSSHGSTSYAVLPLKKQTTHSVPSPP